MNIFGILIFFGMLAKVSAKCADSCECPEFPLMRIPGEDDFQFTKLAGCAANATCITATTSVLLSFFTTSEIPIPTGNPQDNFEIIVDYPDNNQPSSKRSYELFSLFGIICDGGSWYATKYPKGILYYVGTEERRYTNFTASYEGKRSKIPAFMW
ncbi:hypothetical protein B9Z55_007438 [Caenorhabditis nigoni]|uniref:Uncharacterized protein n=2 Tax=Caenorhabditis nigoni TaxID=1611254 RepID=A0A2G5V9U0_9PELO|nr:hypothetical protein B9Z55_007438 [Caenorhabditis nigoni]